MLHEDPQFAAEYLNAVLEDGNQKELMLALRRIAEALGGVSKLAEQPEAQRNHALPHPLPSRQPRAQKPHLNPQGDRDANRGAAAQTRSLKPA